MSKKEKLNGAEITETVCHQGDTLIPAAPPVDIEDLKAGFLEAGREHFGKLFAMIRSIPIDQRVFSNVFYNLENSMLWYNHIVKAIVGEKAKEAPAESVTPTENSEPSS